MLDLNSLYEQGGFAGAPVKREVSYTAANGEQVTGTVWIRRLSYQSAVGDLKSIGDENRIAAARIATCCVDENGDPLYTVADITGYYDDGKPVLDPEGNPRGGFVESLLMALWQAIAEVNSLGKNRS